LLFLKQCDKSLQIISPLSDSNFKDVSGFHNPEHAHRSISYRWKVRQELVILILVRDDLGLEVNSKQRPKLMMLPHLANGSIRLVSRVSHVHLPVERSSLASYARANLSEHDIADSQLLELILAIRLIVFLVDHERRSESEDVCVCHTYHLFIMLVFVIHVHGQRLDALRVY